jgi:broad specificity phosphatase PhoE
MAEQYLILIRHSQSQPIPGVDAQRWPLAPEGQGRAAALAPRLARYQPGVVFSSYERKAVQTAQIVAEGLHIPYVLWPGLHEHVRTAVPYFDRATFLNLVQDFFARPDELIFGSESANQTLTRFEDALDDLVSSYPRRTIAAVSHGTVLSLYLAPVAGRDPFEFWQSLGEPAFAVLRLPSFELVELVESL